MPLDKVLQKIQSRIKDLAPSLELFVDEGLQPGVKECEKLQGQLSDLQECIAVYKHFKVNNELSPSFNIHAKVSEFTNANTTAANTEIQESSQERKPKKEQREQHGENLKPEGNSRKAFSVGINDKFRFINELFVQNSSEYHIAVEQLSNLHTWHETEIYLNSLKSVYDWKDNNEVVKYFYSVVKKRFD
jgi:hypothetical protein